MRKDELPKNIDNALMLYSGYMHNMLMTVTMLWRAIQVNRFVLLCK